MKSSTVVWVVVVILVLLGLWYWISYMPSPAATTNTNLGIQGSTTQTNTGQLATPVVTVAHDAKLRDMLVATNGMTLYRYTKDAPGVSNCSGTCAVNWPPYMRAGAEPLVSEANATGTLATITRSDGGTQITYNDVPLYFWKNDKKPGDTTGQGVGGVWFVVKP